jgi:hypothetical protein
MKPPAPFTPSARRVPFRRAADRRAGRSRLRPCLEALEDRRVPAAVFGDFNGDGHTDLAVAAPNSEVDGVRAGVVQVIYGRDGGLDRATAQTWHQNRFGVLGDAAEGDRFGAALAAGDFDGDGRDDLVVGIPGKDVGPLADAGAVLILHGSAGGLTYTRNQVWTQDSPGIADEAQPYDEFGSALATGNFDGGRDDLAIGVPGENDGRTYDSGAVHVLYGAPRGLSAARAQLITQGANGTARESYDFFGSALAAGDFGGSFHDELIVGTPGQRVNGRKDAGEVNFFTGSADRLDLAMPQVLHQDSSMIAETAGAGDYFGSSLAVGDFNGGGLDLAVGVPGEYGATDGGAVHVFYHPVFGKSGTRIDDVFTQSNRAGVEFPAADAMYGAAIAAGDFNDDGRDDLAVGIPGEAVNFHAGAGAVDVLYGSSAGLGASGATTLTEATLARKTTPGANDGFGAVVAAGRAATGGPAMLAIGVPGDDFAPTANAGSVRVLLGQTNGPFHRDVEYLFTQNGLGGWAAQPGASFGGTLPLSEHAAVPALQTDPDSGGKRILLDFTGYKMPDGRPSDGFDIDGNMGGMNRTERAMIRDVWAFVAEDFAPFNVNVSTVEGDPTFVFANEYRVAIGSSARRFGEEDSSGIHYEEFPLVDAFLDRGDPYDAVYVFSWDILRWNGQQLEDAVYAIGSTASHEAGHGFGLGHKSDIDTDVIWPFDDEIREYSNGGPGWAPLMGDSVNWPDKRSIWTQERVTLGPGVAADGDNDMLDLSDFLGYRPDDHGSRTDAATWLGALTPQDPTRTVGGVIEKRDDNDVFRFRVLSRSLVRVRLDVADVGANLDSTLSLMRRDGPTAVTFIASAAPADDLGATVEAWLSPGDYFIQVGSNRVFTGDVGRYTLRIGPGDLLAVPPPPGLENPPLFPPPVLVTVDVIQSAPVLNLVVGVDLTLGSGANARHLTASAFVSLPSWVWVGPQPEPPTRWVYAGILLPSLQPRESLVGILLPALRQRESLIGILLPALRQRESLVGILLPALRETDLFGPFNPPGDTTTPVLPPLVSGQDLFL